jgi:hypothetical protein
MTPEENETALELAQDYYKLLSIARANVPEAMADTLSPADYKDIATVMFIQLRRDRKCREEASAPSTDKQKAYIMDLVLADQSGAPGNKNATTPSLREVVKNEALAEVRAENLDQISKAYASELIERLKKVRA